LGKREGGQSHPARNERTLAREVVQSAHSARGKKRRPLSLRDRGRGEG